jgi:hypothetical protein
MIATVKTMNVMPECYQYYSWLLYIIRDSFKYPRINCKPTTLDCDLQPFDLEYSVGFDMIQVVEMMRRYDS